MLNKSWRLYREAYSGLSQPIWLLSLVTLINRSGKMVLPFISVYLTRELNFTVAQAGLILSMFGVGSVIGSFIGGKLSDRIGFMPVQFWSLFLGGIFFMVLVLMKTFISVAVCVLIVSIVSEAFRPANFAAIAYYSTPENRTRAYSLNRLAINLGFSIGPSLGGIMAFYSYNSLFIADGLTCIASGFMLKYLLSGNAIPAAKDVVEKENGTPKTTLSPYKDKLYVIFVLLVCLYAICFFQFFSTVPLHYKLNCHLDEFAIGLLMSLNGIVIVLIEMVIVYRLEKNKKPLMLISLGVLFLAISYCLFIVENTTMVFIIAFVLLITISEILSMPFMNTFVVERSQPETRGGYLAFYSMAYSFSHIIAPTLGTQIVGRWGFDMLWNVLAGISLAVVAGFIALHQYIEIKKIKS